MIIENGAVKNNSAALSSLGKKALIVTTASAAERTGALSDVKEALDKKGVSYEIFSGVEPNPTYKSVSSASDAAIKSGCDFVIGIGGGSALDAAKAVALLAANPGISEEDAFSYNVKNAPLPIAAVGTTAGTGSEVTRYAVITTSEGVKKSIANEALLPDIALGDVKYLTFMSPYVLKSTALDAMCHAFESYFNRLADDFSDTFAIRALKLLIPEFETISSYGTDGLDEKDFEALYLASIYAGLAIETTGTTMCHALSYYLSEEKDIPHGYACALFLPAFLMHSSKWEPERAAALYDEILRTEGEVMTLATDLTEAPELKLDEADLKKIRPRLSGNKSLLKCPGETSPEYFEEIIKALFM